MHLKETLTIKPDGFKIKVRPRTDQRARRLAGRAAAAAAARTRSAPRARTRPGHNTPLLVLYGSNLGTAEELATRVADLAEVNGFATTLAPLDDYVGKLPEQGGVLIFCASYNGAAPDNATQFVKWLGGDLPKDALRQGALRRVRLRQQRLGGDLSVDSALHRRAVGRAWRAAASMRAARATPAAISTASSSTGSPRPRPQAVKEFGVDFELQPQRRRRAAVQRSSRWRRRRSTPSSRSAAPRR